ncbi:MAG: hypothetical protein ACRCUY_03575 [Thermoguttaceae bacterium]
MISRWHFRAKILFFSTLLIIVLVTLVMWSFRCVYGPIDPEKLDRGTVIRIMELRDFRRFSPELLAEMTSRVEAEFGIHAAQKPDFRFSDLEKRIYSYFQKNRSQSPSYFEQNLRLMGRTRYFDWMNRYETFSKEERGVLMRNITDEMKYWENVYMDFLRGAEIPIPPLAVLIQEFMEMIESFKEGASQEDAVRVDQFKQKLNEALVARAAADATKGIQGNLEKLLLPQLGTLFPLQKSTHKTNTTEKSSEEQ